MARKMGDVEGIKALIIANMMIERLKRCKKYTYNHINDNEGNYEMPKLPENKRQRKGEAKWVNLDTVCSKSVKDDDQVGQLITHKEGLKRVVFVRRMEQDKAIA
eukprot:9929242-Ditylum_brightwellii.AAC.1